MAKIENIALFDMDGTLCDYENGLHDSLEMLKSPEEPPTPYVIRDNVPPYIKARANLIRGSEEWWEGLPPFKLGFDILEVAKDLGYEIMILTQGPRRNPVSWSGKKRWIDKHLGEDVNITITRDKGLMYGKVMVDDFPGYIERWLEWRPRGLVIMPASRENGSFYHSNVIRYDGTNLDEVRKAMEQAKLRQE